MKLVYFIYAATSISVLAHSPTAPIYQQGTAPGVGLVWRQDRRQKGKETIFFIHSGLFFLHSLMASSRICAA